MTNESRPRTLAIAVLLALSYQGVSAAVSIASEKPKIPPKKRYTEGELVGFPEAFRKQFGGKNGHSKYFCVDENGETVWLTD